MVTLDVFSNVVEITSRRFLTTQAEGETEGKRNRHNHILNDGAGETSHPILTENSELADDREDREQPDRPLGEGAEDADRIHSCGLSRAHHDSSEDIRKLRRQDEDQAGDDQVG